MLQLPDLTEPRYLDEIGWFLYHEKYGRDQFDDTYDQERLAYSPMFLEEVTVFAAKSKNGLESRTCLC